MNTPHRWMMDAVKQPLRREDFEIEPPGEAEVIVKIAGCGVCHTDLGYLYDGVRTNQPLPLTLGHEISGRVIEAGQAAEQWQGQAVIIPAVIPCGTCDHCERGLGTICRQQKMPGNDIPGGFATHIRVPAHGLCPVNEERLVSAGLGLADVVCSLMLSPRPTRLHFKRRLNLEILPSSSVWEEWVLTPFRSQAPWGRR